MSYCDGTNRSDDADDLSRLVNLVERAAAEAALLPALLTEATDVQWVRSPSQGPADTSGRRIQGTHSDPTADAVVDPARLHLSNVLKRSEPVLKQALVLLRGVRIGLDRSLHNYYGAENEPGAA